MTAHTAFPITAAGYYMGDSHSCSCPLVANHLERTI